MYLAAFSRFNTDCPANPTISDIFETCDDNRIGKKCETASGYNALGVLHLLSGKSCSEERERKGVEIAR